MEKILTPEQKREYDMFKYLKDSPARQNIVDILKERLNEIDGILLGEKRIVDGEDPNKYENLDKIKYSKSSILRENRKIYKDLIDYPDAKMNNLGVYASEKPK